MCLKSDRWCGSCIPGVREMSCTIYTSGQPFGVRIGAFAGCRFWGSESQGAMSAVVHPGVREQQNYLDMKWSLRARYVDMHSYVMYDSIRRPGTPNDTKIWSGSSWSEELVDICTNTCVHVHDMA